MEYQRESPNNCFFGVKKSALKLNGGETDLWVVHRTDRKGKDSILGTFEDSRPVISNRDLVNAVYSAFKNLGIKDSAYKERTFLAENGARFCAQYTLQGVEIRAPKVNDNVGLRLLLRNSYDEGMSSFFVELIRVVCTNGMVAKSRFDYHKSHDGEASIRAIGESIVGAVKSFKSSSVDILGEMASQPITGGQGNVAIENMMRERVISSSIGDRMLTNWREPKHTADYDRNLYNLYNAFTRHLMLEEKNTGRIDFDRHRRISRRVFNLFYRVTTVPEEFEKLTGTGDPKLKCSECGQRLRVMPEEFERWCGTRNFMRERAGDFLLPS